MHKLTLVTGLLLSLCLLVSSSILVASSSFCAGKANGVYAKADAPQTFYGCSNGITYIQNCQSGLVFDVSCMCCDWPKVTDSPPLQPTTIPSQVIPPTINATVVFDVSCNCCNYPKASDAPPLLPTTIPSRVIPPTINATVAATAATIPRSQMHLPCYLQPSHPK
ncbi:hypothetical protein UPYG_G00241940 [Umbra pygmaea]|uniref:chitinase n=1 Tax=Umbra pygmaea TaxID=75934 RepID=A0ABD0WFI6_UMBPY